jgi:DNA-binding NarL/FixJ family response regulator
LSVISVLVANDHPLVREHLGKAISADERLELIGEAGDGTEALQKIEKRHPDSVLLDVAMPVLDGAAVLERLRERGLSVRVLLLAGHADVGQMRNALRHRPDSLVLMDMNAEEICDELVAIETGAVSSGRLNLERAQLLARNRVELSGREWEVLKLSAEGLARAEIGERLRFGPSTIRDIRRDICTKLGAPSIQVAIVVAMRTGLLEVGPRNSMEPGVEVLKIT